MREMFRISLCTDLPYAPLNRILSCFAGAFLAVLCWVVVMTRFDLSYAYPFISLTFVLVLGLSAMFFHESITPCTKL